MKLRKLFTKLNESGVIHWTMIAPVVVVVLVAAVGAKVLTASHADPVLYQDATVCGASNNQGAMTVITVCPSIWTDVTNHYGTVQATYTIESSGVGHTLYPASNTVVLYQCEPTGSPCGVIAANGTLPNEGGLCTTFYSIPGSCYTQVTSIKNFAFGHTYKACASFAGSGGLTFTNVCSPVQSAVQT